MKSNPAVTRVLWPLKWNMQGLLIGLFLTGRHDDWTVIGGLVG